METKIVKMSLAQYEVWVGSGSIWANPKKDGTLEERRDAYRKHLSTLDTSVLKGKILGCQCNAPVCCYPRKCSTGDILLELTK